MNIRAKKKRRPMMIRWAYRYDINVKKTFWCPQRVDYWVNI